MSLSDNQKIFTQKIEKTIENAIENKINKLFDNQISEWMTTKEAAVYLRISEGNLRTKVSRGQIQVHGRLGNSWRFRRDELDKLLNNPNQGDFND